MVAHANLISEAYLSTNETLNFPTNIEELKSISSLLKASYSKNARFILLLYSSAYLYKQSFAIPGSVFLVSFSLISMIFKLKRNSFNE